MTAIQFFNSSVRSFNGSVGWGNQESRVTIQLVEDKKLDNYFAPTDIGLPALFSCGAFNFVGLLENWTQNSDFSGFPTYSVSLTDPRVLFDGVNIILNDYFGTIDVPNTFNVYGYLENEYGFGYSKRNESGIPWRKIVQGLNELQSNNTRYGQIISYKSGRYRLDLTGLPQIPDNYRISGNPSITLMSFISEVCEVANCDFAIDLDSELVIRIYTMSRNFVPTRGIISQFITSVQGATQKDIGEEMVNEPCSKMVIGGKVNGIYLVNKHYGDDEGTQEKNELSREDNTITQYWGYYNDNTLVIPKGKNKVFTLDSRNVVVKNLGDTYKTDEKEMRAAISGQSDWEAYLGGMVGFEFYPEEDGEEEANIWEVNSAGKFIEGTTTYKHDNEENPHFRKTFDLKLGSVYTDNIIRFLLNQNVQTIVDMNPQTLVRSTPRNHANDEEIMADRLYKYIFDYADEYYGKKYMVIVPEVEAYRDNETGDKFFSHLPIDSGYVAEKYFNSAIANRILPLSLINLLSPDNRLYPYVRFNNGIDEEGNNIISSETIDLREANPDDLLYGIDFIKSTNTGTSEGSVFIRCNQQSEYVFLYPNVADSPRVIIELPNRILKYTEDSKGLTIIAEFLRIFNEQKSTTQSEKDSINDKLKKFIGSTLKDYFSLRFVAEAVIPDLAAPALESQTETYGPWIANTAFGKTDIEYDADLVPWNYGGFTNMNLAGKAKVSEILGNLQFSEHGSFTVPGLPAFSLGLQLAFGGPYITDVNCQVGTEGLTTTYSMKTWTPRFGKLSKYNAERLQKIDKFKNEIYKNVRQLIDAKVQKNVG